MKVFFDNNGALVVQGENNTEMIALEAWKNFDISGGCFRVEPKAHQEVCQIKNGDLCK
jgi:hypothetical protein